jgi:hypothetical protein
MPILGWLIIHAPTDAACKSIGKEIVTCKDIQSVIDLGAHYHNHFIHCCGWLVHCSWDSTHQFYNLLVKATKAPTPMPTDHPSRPSFDVDKVNVQQKLELSPEGHQAAKSAVSEVHIP